MLKGQDFIKERESTMTAFRETARKRLIRPLSRESDRSSCQQLSRTRVNSRKLSHQLLVLVGQPEHLDTARRQSSGAISRHILQSPARVLVIDAGVGRTGRTRSRTASAHLLVRRALPAASPVREIARKSPNPHCVCHGLPVFERRVGGER